MDEKIIDALRERFMKHFPVEFTAIRPLKNMFNSIEEYHNYSVEHGKDAFIYHRKHKRDLPALFFIPFDRRMVNERGNSFLSMGKKVGVLHDGEPNSQFCELVVGCNFTSDLSKNLAVTVISGILDDFNAKFYTFTTEAYVLKVKNQEDIGKQKGTIANHPDRREIVMVHTTSPTQTFGTHFEIQDNQLGKEEKLGMSENDALHSGGRFSNLFKEIVSTSKSN